MSTKTLRSSTSHTNNDHGAAYALQTNDPEHMKALRIPTVLIIEDNPEDVDLTKLAFQASGLIADFQVCSSGPVAIDYLESLSTSLDPRPDLILLDLNLPMVTGMEVLAYIRRYADLADLPTIVLTSVTSRRDFERCKDLGIQEFLIKPTTLQEMLEMMKRIAPLLGR